MEEYLTLSTDEKQSMIKSHLKTLQHSKYNVELYIIEEAAAGTNDGQVSNTYEEQLASIVAKEAALVAELEKIQNQL